MNRRQFLENSALIGAGIVATGSLSKSLFADHHQPVFKISLAQWSLHRGLFDKKIDNLDFAKIARNDFGIEGIEYVNQFFKDKANDETYLSEMKKRAEDHEVTSLLIMCDGEGQLGHPDQDEREQTVENHHKWVEAAKFLGCHSIRVNAASKGSYEEQQKLAADGLRKLCEYADPFEINVIVENHGGLSSNGAWLSEVIKMVDHPRAGTLPDFGNFRVDEDTMYDRYKGVSELMPYARAVSAKSHDFDEKGDEIHTDYFKMMDIVLGAGYHGYLGIEYEGSKLDEYAGIRATKDLLERVLAKKSDE
jgi:sugar phosphate isomerase/epimerase